MEDWPAFHDLARRKHGVVRPSWGKRYGIDPRVIRRRAAREGWSEPHPGVFTMPGMATDFWTAASAALTAAPSAALTGRTALHARGALDEAPETVHLVAPHSTRNRTLEGVTVRRSRGFHRAATGRLRDLTVVTPARALRDVAIITPVSRLRPLVIEALQRRATDLEAVRAEVGASGHPLVRRRLGSVIEELAESPVDSIFEWDVVQTLRSRGLEPWQGPFPWRCQDGVLVHLDVAFPWAWFAIECEGAGKRQSVSSFRSDRRRWSQITLEWQILWLDWDRWRSSRDDVLAEIERRLGGADRSRAPALPGA